MHLRKRNAAPGSGGCQLGNLLLPYLRGRLGQSVHPFPVACWFCVPCMHLPYGGLAAVLNYRLKVAACQSCALSALVVRVNGLGIPWTHASAFLTAGNRAHGCKHEPLSVHRHAWPVLMWSCCTGGCQRHALAPAPSGDHSCCASGAPTGFSGGRCCGNHLPCCENRWHLVSWSPS